MLQIILVLVVFAAVSGFIIYKSKKKKTEPSSQPTYPISDNPGGGDVPSNNDFELKPERPSRPQE